MPSPARCVIFLSYASESAIGIAMYWSHDIFSTKINTEYEGRNYWRCFVVVCSPAIKCVLAKWHGCLGWRQNNNWTVISIVKWCYSCVNGELKSRKQSIQSVINGRREPVAGHGATRRCFDATGRYAYRPAMAAFPRPLMQQYHSA